MYVGVLEETYYHKMKNDIIDLDSIYPIGAIYLSANDVNPGTFLGGVWDRIAAGSTLLGAGTVQEYITTGMADGNPVETLTTSIYNVGDTGGERQHRLTTDEIPSHRHTVEVRNDGNPDAWEDKSSAADRQYWNSGYNSFAQQYNKIPSTADTGGGGYHNNLPPYLVISIWQRVQ